VNATYWITWIVIAALCAVLAGAVCAGLTVAWYRWNERREQKRWDEELRAEFPGDGSEDF
jgi:hypothetical protein